MTSVRPDPSVAKRVLAFRVALFAFSAMALAVAVGIMRTRAERPSRRYVCPMHAEITSSAPGECPICRMELELEAAPGAGPSFNPSTYQTYDFVRRRGFGQDVHAPAWVDESGEVVATVYADEAAALDPDAPGDFSPAAAPDHRAAVHLVRAMTARWDASTDRVRFRLDEGEAAPAPGAVGWVRIRARRRDLEVVPYSAVLESTEGPYVLVASREGHAVTRRAVEVGRVIGGQAIVTSGLRVGERILVRSAFFVDAERRLHDEATVELPP